MVEDGAFDENSNFCSQVFESLGQVPYTIHIGFYKAGRGSSTSCMGKYLKHLKPKMSQMALGRPPSWMGIGSHRASLGQIGFLGGVISD